MTNVTDLTSRRDLCWRYSYVSIVGGGAQLQMLLASGQARLKFYLKFTRLLITSLVTLLSPAAHVAIASVSVFMLATTFGQFETRKHEYEKNIFKQFHRYFIGSNCVPRNSQDRTHNLSLSHISKRELIPNTIKWSNSQLIQNEVISRKARGRVLSMMHNAIRVSNRHNIQQCVGSSCVVCQSNLRHRKVSQSRRHPRVVDPHHASILGPSATGPETRRRLSQHFRPAGRQIFSYCDARSLKPFLGIKNLPQIPVLVQAEVSRRGGCGSTAPASSPDPVGHSRVDHKLICVFSGLLLYDEYPDVVSALVLLQLI
ncbi:hypothetical protein J6590_041114 [Homalodisca vitripennis]|nr:hypothetical protein J6590_041114 [Homalodisca vitripennis]